MLLKKIKETLGGDVSIKNSKMPGTSFGLSTDFCEVGGKLRDIEGSVCEACYARRLENLRPLVKKGWTSRAEAVRVATCCGLAEQNQWVDAMVERLKKLSPTHHRWHDSGDLLNDRHLSMLVSVAQRLPDINFWLPTKERAIVKRVRKAMKDFGGLPKNLVVRESAAMVGEKLDIKENNSMVFDTKLEYPDDVWICPASHQGNTCKDCRACWDSQVVTVAYPKH